MEGEMRGERGASMLGRPRSFEKTDGKVIQMVKREIVPLLRIVSLGGRKNQVSERTGKSASRGRTGRPLKGFLVKEGRKGKEESWSVNGISVKPR